MLTRHTYGITSNFYYILETLKLKPSPGFKKIRYKSGILKFYGREVTLNFFRGARICTVKRTPQSFIIGN